MRAREATAFTNVYYHDKRGRLIVKRVLKGGPDDLLYSGADFRENKTAPSKKGSGKQ